CEGRRKGTGGRARRKRVRLGEGSCKLALNQGMAEAGIESKRGLGIFTALWAVVLIAAFFAYRGGDVGKLPGLFSNLGGGPLIGESAFDSLVGLIVSVLIIQAWL